jgi:chorismate lyase
MWLDKDQLAECKHQINEKIYYWLTEVKQTTDEITKQGLVLNIRVLVQDLADFLPDEVEFLHGSHTGLIREVLMFVNNQALIFARSAIPEATYLNYKADFDNLGDKSIGNVLLHHNKDIIRSDFSYKLFDDSAPLFSTVAHNHQIPTKLWGRCSRFSMPLGEVLITEVFL